MKKITILLAVVLMAGAAFAAQGKAAGKTHRLTMEVVSTDAAAKTVTLKDDKGATSTMPVQGRAATTLGGLKAGEKVTVMYRDNAKGEHEAVVGIRPAATKRATKPATKK